MFGIPVRHQLRWAKPSTLYSQWCHSLFTYAFTYVLLYVDTLTVELGSMIKFLFMLVTLINVQYDLKNVNKKLCIVMHILLQDVTAVQLSMQ